MRPTYVGSSAMRAIASRLSDPAHERFALIQLTDEGIWVWRRETILSLRGGEAIKPPAIQLFLNILGLTLACVLQLGALI